MIETTSQCMWGCSCVESSGSGFLYMLKWQVELLAKMLVHASSVLETRTTIFKCYLRSVDGWWFTSLGKSTWVTTEPFHKGICNKSCYYWRIIHWNWFVQVDQKKLIFHGINPGWNEMKRVKSMLKNLTELGTLWWWNKGSKLWKMHMYTCIVSDSPIRRKSRSLNLPLQILLYIISWNFRYPPQCHSPQEISP